MPEPGTTLAHYRLTEKIGAGGMGEVWKARDTSLERDVAVKILPDVFSSDPDRLARFEREAKLLASLNHPHIAAIYGLHEEVPSAPSAGPSISSTASGQAGPGPPAGQAAIRFLAMELVDGADLGARLADGPLPVEEALELARQIAEAMEAAHDSGVMHRDLKPDNIQVTPDGQVKVLDFGLAKPFMPDPASGSASLSPTVTSMGTQDGIILGTAAYMSPEQAKGKPVDRRADIWAFGAVLFEMLTGRMLCRGETISETLATVLMGKLRFDLLPAALPAPVRRLLLRCLERDPRRRLRDIGEARVLLEDLQAGRLEAEAPAGGAVAGEAEGSPRSALLLAAGALAAGALLSWLALQVLGPAPAPQPLRRFLIPSDAAALHPSISPDGTRLAYVDEGRIWLRRLDRIAPRELAEMPGATTLFWSPDGDWIAFAVRDRVWKIPAEGGEPVRVATLPEEVSALGGNGGAWPGDGRIYMTTGNGGLLSMPERGGDVTTALEARPEVEDDFHGVSALPGGRGVIFPVHRLVGTGEGIGVDTVATWDGTERKDVLQLPGEWVLHVSYSSSGHLLVTLSSEIPELWAVPFDLDGLEVTGEKFLVASNASRASTSEDGTLVFARGGGFLGKNRFSALDRGGNLWDIGEPRGGLFMPRISPDGTRMASTFMAGDKLDIWITDLERGSHSRLTFAAGPDAPVAWMPGGEELVHLENVGSSDVRLVRRRVDGSGEAEVLLERKMNPGGDVSPDGRYALLNLDEDRANPALLLLPLDPPGEATIFLDSPAREVSPAISPDGGYAAYQSDESGRPEIYLTRFPSAEGRWQVSVEGGSWPRWGAGGKELYFVSGSKLMAIELSLEGVPRRGQGREVSAGWESSGAPQTYDVLPDGSGVVVVRPAEREEGEETGIVVVEGWIGEFRE